jgi:hypothetical protein
MKLSEAMEKATPPAFGIENLAESFEVSIALAEHWRVNGPKLVEVLDWLVHLNNGVGKDGGKPSMTEWGQAYYMAGKVLKEANEVKI